MHTHHTMFRYAVWTLFVAAAMTMGDETAQPAAEQPGPAVAAAPKTEATAATTDSLTWTEVIECYKKPRAAIGCLETRMDRALGSMRDTAVKMARSDPETAAEDVAGVGDLVQQIGEFITYGISSYFKGPEEEETVAEGAPANVSADVNEGRGSHKKKKIQKEIKKFVLKVLFGIYLFKQKIKMILMSIQSILMSKFLVVAMVYALSNTFKIWYDIKSSKHHHHDKVVYYENAHHQHHYEPPEHSDYEEHPHGFGSIWGRSIAVTEPSSIEHHSGPSGPHDGISRYVRRVTRTAGSPQQPGPTAAGQTMAFNAQVPRK